MDLRPPRLDIPVSRLFVELQWPDGYDLKFKGSLQAVVRFSSSLPKPVSHDVGAHIVQSGFDFNRVAEHVTKAGVNVQVPRSGQSSRFEQLLVVDGCATLIAEYIAKVVKDQLVEVFWWIPRNRAVSR